MGEYLIPNFKHKNTVYLKLNTPIYFIPKNPGRPCQVSREHVPVLSLLSFVGGLTYRSFSLHVTRQKNYIGNLPVEEAKKMKCYKTLIHKQFSKSQVFVAHSFWLICRNVSRIFVVGALHGDAILAYRFVAPWRPILPSEINKNIWSSLFL